MPKRPSWRAREGRFAGGSAVEGGKRKAGGKETVCRSHRGPLKTIAEWKAHQMSYGDDPRFVEKDERSVTTACARRDCRRSEANLKARLRERVRCSSRVDWPVYPRLAHTMRASNDAQCGAGAGVRNALALRERQPIPVRLARRP
jgi:hypothetical protein